MRVGVKTILLIALLLLSIGLPLGTAAAQTTPIALAGRVTSAQEGAMEGVLVSAHQEGSPITVTVVSDASGRYAFPADRLAPGRYALAIRAAGYALDGAPSAAVAAGSTATADLTLRKAKDLAAQL